MLKPAALEAAGVVGQLSGSGPHAELLSDSCGSSRANCHPPVHHAAQTIVSHVRVAMGSLCCLVSHTIRKKHYNILVFCYNITVIQTTFLSKDLLQIPVYLILELKVEDN